ncbi:MAG: 16S rRNA (guanine(527)-N(7))-methyltransferase RsmG [SAR324 cluster bacterium]|nr:16S rRNA (guanine(527)-N(7))-methyltransferase RsmG [SAR324 cluster bacterium]
MQQESYQLIEPMLHGKGVYPTAAQQARIERFVELIVHWNRSINLVGDVERIYSRHILDCLMLEALPWPEGALEILDTGSGAGLPGVLVAVMHPLCQVTSLDTVSKKATFQQVAAHDLQLDNFTPRRMDVHSLAAGEGQGRYDLMLARAMAGLDTLLGLGAELLRPGGRLWAMKGAKLEAEQKALRPEWLESFEPDCERFDYEFPEFGGGGVIAMYRKRAEAPTAAR